MRVYLLGSEAELQEPEVGCGVRRIGYFKCDWSRKRLGREHDERVAIPYRLVVPAKAGTPFDLQ
jgi:hypothetical protein